MPTVVLTQPTNQTRAKKAKKKSNIDSRGFTNSLASDLVHLHAFGDSDRVFVKQMRELQDDGARHLGTLGCDTTMRYEVINNKNQTIYTVEEGSDWFERCWFGGQRPLYAHVKDGDGNSLMYIDRPLACQSCCFPCSLQSMTVQSPPGTAIGWIEQQWGLRPIFHVKDETNTTLFVIKGMYCHFSCRCEEIDFPIYTANGKTKCGKVSNRWGKIIHQDVYEEENFGVLFPPRTNYKMKGLLLAAAFLINYTYFLSAIQ